jgi:hypothetical protein
MFYYGFRLNAALAHLGCSPTIFQAAFRRLMQIEGFATGYSPQEVALVMVAQLPIAHRAAMPPAVVDAYIRKGKVDPTKPHVQEALGRLAIFGMTTTPPSWRSLAETAR